MDKGRKGLPDEGNSTHKDPGMSECVESRTSKELVKAAAEKTEQSQK